MSGSIKRVPKVTGRGYDLVRGPVKKSSAGERTIRLSPTLVGLVRDHRRRQAAERDRAGPYWVETGLMFPLNASRRILAQPQRTACLLPQRWRPDSLERERPQPFNPARLLLTPPSRPVR
ncbi:MAG: hypothetical protein ACYDH5_03200 [Acidimicrobiales bacterium]